jgi:hypothetical protein
MSVFAHLHVCRECSVPWPNAHRDTCPRAGHTHWRADGEDIEVVPASERDDWSKVAQAYRAENERLADLLREVAMSGIESSHRGYLSVQIDRATWDELQQFDEEK